MVRRWGELLHRSWSLKRVMSDSVSRSEIDTLYEKALAAGAWGGKVIGAGGGGFLLIMAPPEQHIEINIALGNLHSVPLRLEPDGSRAVYVNEKL